QAHANAEAFMKTMTMAGALVAAATLLVVDGAQARRFHDYEYYGGYYGGWGAAAAGGGSAKTAARAAHDPRHPGVIPRCFERHGIWNGARYAWRLVNIC